MPNPFNTSAAVAGQMTLVFVVLKLAGQTTADWLWVLTPLWLYAGLTIAVGFIGGFIKAFKASRNSTIRL